MPRASRAAWLKHTRLHSRCHSAEVLGQNGRAGYFTWNRNAAFEARKAQVPKANGKDVVKDVVFDALPRPWRDDVREHAGVTDYRWHDNRHTFCSRLAMRKVNLVAIKELAGHKTLAITARYAHLDDDAKREAVDSLLMLANSAIQTPPSSWAEPKLPTSR